MKIQCIWWCSTVSILLNYNIIDGYLNDVPLLPINYSFIKPFMCTNNYISFGGKLKQNFKLLLCNKFSTKRKFSTIIFISEHFFFCLKSFEYYVFGFNLLLYFKNYYRLFSYCIWFKYFSIWMDVIYRVHSHQLFT